MSKMTWLVCQVLELGLSDIKPSCCSVAKSCPTLCSPMNCSTPGFHYPSISLRVCSNSCPLSQWCHLTISSSATPFSSHFSSCPQSFPSIRAFPVSWLFALFGQSMESKDVTQLGENKTSVQQSSQPFSQEISIPWTVGRSYNSPQFRSVKVELVVL